MEGVESPIDVSEINPQPIDQTSEGDLSRQDTLPGEFSKLGRVALCLIEQSRRTGDLGEREDQPASWPGKP